MIFRSILSGRTVHGFRSKRVIHPYTGASPDSLEYAQDLGITPFVDIQDIQAFRSVLTTGAATTSRYLEKNSGQITSAVADETGSPVSYHRADLEGSRMFLQTLHTLGTMLPKKYVFEPKGNVLLILSANEPIITSTILIFSSLFMGNTVFVKPSSKSPTYSYLLIKELTKIPSLKERVHYLLADSREIERLIRSKRFNFVLSFGSRSTNKKLQIMCAESEVEFLQESEGNDWAYVDRDYPSLKKMSKVIVNSFVRHNGQMCNAMRGVMVHASLYDRLVRQLKHDIAALFVESPGLVESRVGALIAGTEASARHLTKEAAAKAEAVWNLSAQDEGTTPTLILNPDDTSPIFSQSIFAPVLWIKKVKNYSEAISFYQEKNIHGLGFSVFSKNKRVIDVFTNRIKVGRININKDPLNVGLFDPLGGIKLSGQGGPSLWIEKVSNRKYINK